MPPSPLWDEREGDTEFRIYDVGGDDLLIEAQELEVLIELRLRWSHVEILRDALTCWLDNG